MSDKSTLKEKELKKLPTSPKKETIASILSFSKSYSVRKGRLIDKMEFLLN